METNQVSKLQECLENRNTVLQEYIKLLELQKSDILNKDFEKLEIHSGLEPGIIERLNSYHKVISALEHQVKNGQGKNGQGKNGQGKNGQGKNGQGSIMQIENDQKNSANKASIKSLQNLFKELSQKALDINRENQVLLQKKMEKVKKELKSFHKYTTSPYKHSPNPALIDILT